MPKLGMFLTSAQYFLACLSVDLLQRITARCGIVMSLVQQVVVPRVSCLPQQVLFIRFLSEASISQVLDVLLFDLPLELSEAAREL